MNGTAMRRFEVHIDGKLYFEGVQFPDGDFAGRVYHEGQPNPIWGYGHDLNTIAGDIEHTVNMIDEHNQAGVGWPPYVSPTLRNKGSDLVVQTEPIY